MTAVGQLLNLPVLSPSPWALRRYAPRGQKDPQYPSGAMQTWQYRLYRLPPRERQDTLCYSANGYATPDRTTGTLIDIYA